MSEVDNYAPPSNLKASVTEAADGALEIHGVEELNYGFRFVDGVFAPSYEHLANIYKPWGRCLLVTDAIVYDLFGKDAEAYFATHGVNLTVHIMPGGEIHKTMPVMLSLVDAFASFGILRKEPVLVMGGGMVTDVVGYACASYRRSINFVRIPTTVIGLIDAGISIKGAVNHGKLKNRLGAFHPSMMTFLDFTFLRTLPIAHIRNGFAELAKITSVAHLETYQLMAKHGEKIIASRFGRAEGTDPELLKIADTVNRNGIRVMLDLEVPNLREIGLNRIMAYGHTWSPTLELTPALPLRHGHAVSIDMAFSVTLAWTRGYITEEERDEFHGMLSRVGLAMDHPQFDNEVIEIGTKDILLSRNNMQRFVVPRPMGTGYFINDSSLKELYDVLAIHKGICAKYPRRGEGLEAHVDGGDLGVDPDEMLADQALKATLGGRTANGLTA